MTTYTQVELQKDNQIDIAWVESSLALLYSRIRVKQDGTWDDGWTITKVYETKLSEQEVREQQTSYRTHRSRTDI